MRANNSEGFDDVVVRPHVQGLHLLRLPVPGGDDDDGGFLGQTAEFLEYLDPIHVRQAQVQQDQVGPVGEIEGQALFPGKGGNGLIVVGA